MGADKIIGGAATVATATVSLFPNGMIESEARVETPHKKELKEMVSILNKHFFEVRKKTKRLFWKLFGGQIWQSKDNIGKKNSEINFGFFFVCVKLLTTDYLIQHLHQNIAFAYYLVREQKTPSDDHMGEEVQYGQIRGVHFIFFRYCYLSLNGNPAT